MNSLMHIRISAAFVWVGFVASISFMEAWLKFTAPGVSLMQGLAIGQVVFGALNKVELCLAGIIILCYVSNFRSLLQEWFLITALVFLVVQSLYVLPMLSHRIDMHLSGTPPPPSQLHALYIIMEVLKVSTLLFYGFKQMK